MLTFTLSQTINDFRSAIKQDVLMGIIYELCCFINYIQNAIEMDLQFLNCL